MKKHGVEGILRKKFLDGDAKEEIEKFLRVFFLTIKNSIAVRKPKTRRDETRDLSFSQGKFSNPKQLKQSGKNLLRAKILSKHKTPLPDI